MRISCQIVACKCVAILLGQQVGVTQTCYSNEYDFLGCMIEWGS